MTEINLVDIIPRLMQRSLPDTVDLWRLAAENGQINGTMALGALPRLAAVPNHADGTVMVMLTARMDNQGRRFVEGEVHAEIELVCQRCLGTLVLPLVAKVSLMLTRSESKAEAALPEGYEALLIGEKRTRVTDLVEDELLLALPQIPRHNDLRECQANGYVVSLDGAMPDMKPHHAFAELASLLRDSKRNN